MEKLDDLSEGELVSCELVRVVADVTDVLVSPSFVVTEFVMFPPCALIWNLLNRSSFSSSQKRSHCGTDTQEEMRYEGSPVKAPDTAYTYAKFVHLFLRGRRDVTKRKAEDGMREKEQSSQGRNSFWKEVTV